MGPVVENGWAACDVSVAKRAKVSGRVRHAQNKRAARAADSKTYASRLRSEVYNSLTCGRTVPPRRRFRSADATGDRPAPGENRFDARMLGAIALRRGTAAPRSDAEAMRTRSFRNKKALVTG